MLARRDGRRKVSAAHKASIMKMTDGLFLDCCREVAERYPDVGYEEIVDRHALHGARARSAALRRRSCSRTSTATSSPTCASGLVGGLGVVPGANIGGDAAVFEAVHGSAPDIAGKNVANPLALMLSGDR